MNVIYPQVTEDMDVDSQSSVEDSDNADDDFIPPRESTTTLGLFLNIEQVYNPWHTGEYDEQEVAEDDIPMPSPKAWGNVAKVDRIQRFLDSINTYSLDKATAEFMHATIMLKSSRPASTEARAAADLCKSMMSAVVNVPETSDTAKVVATTWKQIQTLNDHTAMSAVEIRMSRALIMWSSWSLFTWVQGMAHDSLTTGSYFTGRTWVDRITNTVIRILRSNILQETRPDWSLSSTDYLQNIPTAIFNCKHSKLSKHATNNEIGQHALDIVTSAIRFWLNFPSDKIHLFQFTFIDTVINFGHYKLALLEEVWNVFQNPVKELLRGGQRRTKGMRMETIFAGFKERLIAHPISDIGSQQHACLQRLVEKSDLFQCQAEMGIYANQNAENQVLVNICRL